MVLLGRKGRILTTLSPYIHLDLTARLLVFAPAAQNVLGERTCGEDTVSKSDERNLSCDRVKWKPDTVLRWNAEIRIKDHCTSVLSTRTKRS